MFAVGCLRLDLRVVVPPPGASIGPSTMGASLEVSIWNLDPLPHDVRVEVGCSSGLLTLSGQPKRKVTVAAVPTSLPGGKAGAVIALNLVHAGAGTGTETLICLSVEHRPTTYPGWYRPVTPTSGHTATAAIT